MKTKEILELNEGEFIQKQVELAGKKITFEKAEEIKKELKYIQEIKVNLFALVYYFKPIV